MRKFLLQSKRRLFVFLKITSASGTVHLHHSHRNDAEGITLKWYFDGHNKTVVRIEPTALRLLAFALLAELSF